MASKTKNFRTAIAQFFAKKNDPAEASHLPQRFDTITLESIVSPRGRNPFPEEEGEMSFIASTMHEQSLHSR